MAITSSVNIAVCGKFHILNYIMYLQRDNIINCLYFSHKRDTAKKFNISTDIARNYPLKEILVQGHSRLLGQRFVEKLYPLYSSIWEQSVLNNWSTAPILHILANGSCLSLAERAKSEGAYVIAEAVNTHPKYRREILIEEAEKWNCLPERRNLLSRESRSLDEANIADILLVPTRTVKETFVNKGFNGKTAKIPYAANLSRFSPKNWENIKSFSSTRPMKLLCVGEVGLRKGQLYILEAMRRMGRKDISLTLVGSIAPSIEKKLIEYQQYFHHIKRVPSHEIRDLICEHDVFILPSLEEGLSVSICEAMACGLSVITTNQAGGEEVIEDGKTGFLIEAGNVDAIEGKLKLLLDNWDLGVEVGKNAANAAKKAHNWEEYASQLEVLYTSLLQK